MKIDHLVLENKVIVAPMAGVTNLAFRKLLTKYQPGLYFNEMISDMALLYDNQRTWEMTKILENERPIAFQIFGNQVDTMVQAAILLDTKTECDVIDINMGCPVQKIVKQGSGSALMKTPELAYQIVREVSRAVSKPVTVKMRIGWDMESMNGVEFAQGLEKAGVSAIFVHGRTRSQMYSGTSSNAEIKKIVDAVSIPVVGNGDIRSAQDAMVMMEETGCDAIMIGRSLMNQPWLIQEIKDKIEGIDSDLKPDVTTRLMITLEHARNLIEQMGESAAMRQMRAHANWAFKGLPHSHTVKTSIVTMETYQDLQTIIDDYLGEFHEL